MIATGCVDERKNEQPELAVSVARNNAVARRLGVRMAGRFTHTIHAVSQASTNGRNLKQSRVYGHGSTTPSNTIHLALGNGHDEPYFFGPSNGMSGLSSSNLAATHSASSSAKRSGSPGKACIGRVATTVAL